MKVWPGLVLAVIVTRLFWEPALPLELNSTNISPVAHGATGSFGQEGTVHPQLPLASLIIKGSEPVLVNLYVWDTFSPSSIVPKSNSLS